MCYSAEIHFQYVSKQRVTIRGVPPAEIHTLGRASPWRVTCWGVLSHGESQSEVCFSAENHVMGCASPCRATLCDVLLAESHTSRRASPHPHTVGSSCGE